MEVTSLVRVVSEPCELGESPFWHPVEQRLYWCDIQGRSLHRLDPVTGASKRWVFASEPACCAPVLGGGVMLGMRDGLWVLDVDTGARRRFASPPYDPAIERFNDGKCDPQGRMWLGTIYEPRDRPAGGLYRWCRHEGLQQVAGGVTTSNGLAWSPDGRTLYWSDTRDHRIDRLDFETEDGGLAHRREWVRFPPRSDGVPYEGRPDGAAVDEQGCYWVAMYEGARILRLSPTGEVLRTLELPVQCPTMPCFGGPGLRTLYVTTARGGRPAEELARMPLSGSVLAIDVDVAGLPANCVCV